jgi:hypothetical protein
MSNKYINYNLNPKTHTRLYVYNRTFIDNEAQKKKTRLKHSNEK